MEKKITYKKRTNLFKTDAWKRFSKNKLALIGSVIILLTVSYTHLIILVQRFHHARPGKAHDRG